MDHILVTGATSGLGLELAKLLPSHFPNHGVILVGRDENRLGRISKCLGEFVSVIPIKCDIAKRGDLESLVEMINSLSVSHGFLVAGSGLANEFSLNSPEVEDELVSATCLGTVVLARHVLTGGGKGRKTSCHRFINC